MRSGKSEGTAMGANGWADIDFGRGWSRWEEADLRHSLNDGVGKPRL